LAKSFQPTLTPEEQARETIDGMLATAGWIVQNRADANIDASARRPSDSIPSTTTIW
jgi:hypothetical protein